MGLFILLDDKIKINISYRSISHYTKRLLDILDIISILKIKIGLIFKAVKNVQEKSLTHIIRKMGC